MTQPKRRTISQRSEMLYDVHTFGILMDTRELFISPGSSLEHGEDDAMISWQTAHQFMRNLQVLNSQGTDPILVHIMSCGGDWNYGMAIYDAIKNSCEDENLSNIVTLSYAHARSMSSIIPQAASWRVIMPSADFLIHFGSWSFAGNQTSAMAEAQWSARMDDIMVDIYAERCKEGHIFKRDSMDKQAIKKWLDTNMRMKQEFYMTAREAVDRGFMDAILGDEDSESIGKLREDL